MKTLTVALVLLVSAQALAEVKHVSWTHPSQYTDNSSLNPADISQTRIEYGSCNGTAFGTSVGNVIAPGNVTTYDVNLNPGTWCIRAFTTAKGVESGPSTVTTTTIVQPAPKPPGTVTVEALAYEIKPQNNLVKVAGTVALGVECRSTTQTVNGVKYTELDPGDVTFKPGNQPSPVWGKCAAPG